MVDLNDPVQRKDFLLTQMRLAEEKMKQSKGEHCATSEAVHVCQEAAVPCCAPHSDNLPEAISHLINFVSLSGNPHEALAALQQSLPPTIFQILVQTMARLGEQVCHEAVVHGWGCLPVEALNAKGAAQHGAVVCAPYPQSCLVL